MFRFFFQRFDEHHMFNTFFYQHHAKYINVCYYILIRELSFEHTHTRTHFQKKTKFRFFEISFAFSKGFVSWEFEIVVWGFGKRHINIQIEICRGIFLWHRSSSV